MRLRISPKGIPAQGLPQPREADQQVHRAFARCRVIPVALILLAISLDIALKLELAQLHDLQGHPSPVNAPLSAAVR
ncbi:hypothetical protein G6F68_020637 [Rhizopus microsporus]|nr:hypothetical protein G6F68_020637 [Rhizopus microsporus]